ncbi:MAG: hypothetical protein P8Z40_15750 [Chloroflexota bacterium]|jgi:hypothetical protein
MRMSIGPMELLIICGILAFFLVIIGGGIALVVVLTRKDKMKSDE